METSAIILAAGSGTRMKSAKPKVAHELLGKPLVRWVVDAAREAGVGTVISVLGHGIDVVRPLVEHDTQVVVQQQRNGTADAVNSAREACEGMTGSLFVLSGDCPLIRPETIAGLARAREEADAAVAVLTMEAENPFGYGRIIRDAQGQVECIVEQKDCTPEQAAVTECNSGFYCFDAQYLFDALNRVSNENAQGEFYLTDVIGIAPAQGRRVCGYQAADSRVAMGANDRKGLLRLNEMARQAELERHLDAGVEIVCADGVVIAPGVSIGQDTTILPGTILKGKTIIGKNCVIGPDTVIEDSTVGDGCQINACQIEKSRLDEKIKIGPFTHVRPNSHLKAGVKIGNFVEVKNSVIDENTAVAHLTYVGDSDVGKNVNFGCGTVTVNFDGHDKYRTVIGDDCFIGCNSNLIAPVEIGSGSYIAAGSTITDRVPEDALAELMGRWFDVDVIVSDAEMYQVCGTKR